MNFQRNIWHVAKGSKDLSNNTMPLQIAGARVLMLPGRTTRPSAPLFTHSQQTNTPETGRDYKIANPFGLRSTKGQRPAAKEQDNLPKRRTPGIR